MADEQQNSIDGTCGRLRRPPAGRIQPAPGNGDRDRAGLDARRRGRGGLDREQDLLRGRTMAVCAGAGAWPHPSQGRELGLLNLS